MQTTIGGSVRVLGFTICVVAAACGGDDDGDKADAGSAPAPAADSGGAMPPPQAGTPATTGLAPVVPLEDDVAGKACASNTDCGEGSCATQITGAAILPADAPEGYCTTDCQSDTDCGAGGACVGALANLVRGQCFATCAADTDCRDGYLCTTSLMLAGLTIPSTCRPKPQTDQLDNGIVGTMCTADADCGEGTCLSMSVGLQPQTLPGGYCTGACLEDSQCGAGAVCAPPLLQGLSGSCYQGCGGDADCTRDGYRCIEVATDVRGCDVFPDPLPDDTAGEPCAEDADCGGGTGACASALPVSGFGAALGQTIPAPGGYCSVRCADDGDCGAGGVCAVSALGAGRCYRPCEDATDCRDGYACEGRGGGGPTMGDAGAAPATLVCVPATPQSADAGVADAGG